MNERKRAGRKNRGLRPVQFQITEEEKALIISTVNKYRETHLSKDGERIPPIRIRINDSKYVVPETDDKGGATVEQR